MKPIAIIFLSALFVFLTLPNMIQADENKVPITTGEWPPFVSEKLPNYGPASEIVVAVCKAAGIMSDIKFYPWKRAEAMIANGNAFGAYPYTIREDRLKKYDFSSPLFKTQVYFFYSKKHMSTKKLEKIKVLEDIKQYIIGGMIGSFQCEELKKAGYRVEMSSKNEFCIKKLDTGRINFFTEERTVAIHEIEKELPGRMNDFGMLDIGYGTATYDALMVSRTYPNASEILKKFEQGLKTVQKNGVYDEIIKRNHLGSGR